MENKPDPYTILGLLVVIGIMLAFFYAAHECGKIGGVYTTTWQCVQPMQKR